MKTIKKELQQAKDARKSIQVANVEIKQKILEDLSNKLVENIQIIVAQNQLDLDKMDPEDAKYDRLVLNAERIKSLAESVKAIGQLEDPTNRLLLSKDLPNGIHLEKKTVPLGVVAVIYEARPNVTIDVAALCIQSGNVCLLRGGTDAWFTNSVLVQLIREVLQMHHLDVNIVQLLPTDRELVSELLEAAEYVDILIPRGSQQLIDYVRQHAKVPVIETGAGVCHTYVEQTADLEKAAKIVANAKISRPSVCNALDTVLIDKEVAEEFLPKLARLFQSGQVKVYGDQEVVRILEKESYPYLIAAGEKDFGREFLSLACSVKVVQNMAEALQHIDQYSSKHSECIVSEDAEKIVAFLNTVDAAAVYANASTRFTDGGEFGLGAEIGISTQKLHARGPFALEKLVTEKWFVMGNGQIRI